jgi:hypothetical protein
MPLREGSSDAVISENIAELMRTGKYEHDQAIAIAYRKAGRSKTLAKALSDDRIIGDEYRIEAPETAIQVARERLALDTSKSNNAILFAVARTVNAAGDDGSQNNTDPKPSVEEKVSGEYEKRSIGWQGLTICIENEAGSHREGVNRDGEKWRQHMPYAYGYINQTTGMDGQEVDVFLGPNVDSADYVYIVRARKVNRWEEYDEDKVMLGFDSEQDAIQAFLESYSDPRFLGPIHCMLVGEFVDKVLNTKDRPTMIKGFFVKGGNGALSDSMRAKIGRVGSEKREEEPEHVFLEPKSRKYPVKVKTNGEWKYSHNLLLAAARRARMEGNPHLAAEADKIREKL